MATQVCFYCHREVNQRRQVVHATLQNRLHPHMAPRRVQIHAGCFPTFKRTGRPLHPIYTVQEATIVRDGVAVPS